MTLERIFEPRSIAVVGASANPAKRGHQILRALDESGYAGRVYAVNHGGGTILGRLVHRSVEALPEAADLAVLCTPAGAAPELVRACGERGIGGAVVLAVGFGESGAEGVRLEVRLRDAARESGVRVLGPNTSGLLNLSRGVNLIGARGVRAGGVALIAQSGNIALDLMNQITRQPGLGVSICAGLGNEADVGFGEVLDYLGRHEETRVVIAHIEGCRDSRGLLAAASSVTRRKPVVALKSGRTAAGARAALSHTGSVAGSYDRLRAGFAQAGIVEIRRTDELLPVAATLGSQPPAPPGAGIAVLSDGGGQSTLVVDTLGELDAPLAELAPTTSAELRRRLGPAAAVLSPVDVAGAADSDPRALARALEVVARDPAVGVVLLVGMFGGYAMRFSATLAASELEAASAMAGAMRALGKGLIVHSQYASHASPPLDALRRAHVPVIRSLDAACRAAAELHRRGGIRERSPGRWLRASAGSPPTVPPGPHPAITAARREGRATLTETEARAVLAEVGLEFEPVAVVRSADEAGKAAARACALVAIKLLSRHITHKSDAGGVELNIADAEAARAAFERIAANAAVYSRSRGFPSEERAATVSPMLDPPVAELLVGAYRDPRLGPVLTVGAGGVWVEVLRDVAHRVLPVDDEELAAALGELKIAALLTGARGRSHVDLRPVVEAAAAVARCVTSYPEVPEAEVNPLFVYADRAVPVDARVILHEWRSDAGSREYLPHETPSPALSAPPRPAAGLRPRAAAPVARAGGSPGAQLRQPPHAG